MDSERQSVEEGTLLTHARSCGGSRLPVVRSRFTNRVCPDYNCRLEVTE